MQEEIQTLKAAFRRRFGGEPVCIATAPGRVNLIGEHTDYMGGFVLPVAIDRHVLFAVAPSGNGEVTGYSLNFEEAVRFRVGAYDPDHPCRWLRYVLGVLREVEKENPALGGFNFCVSGDVPLGSGLSSSAAFELAVLTAVRALFPFWLGKKEAALLCQRAENDFVGVRCGIMDQFISSAGVADCALKIDCRDLSYEAIRAAVPGCTWLVVDSRKRRGLVDSEYNARHSQCHAGLKFLQGALPDRNIANVREVSLSQLVEVQDGVGAVVFKRLRHVITENQRVLKVCEALRRGDLPALGKHLYASHQSLRDDFEVSCAELDALVALLSRVPGTVGARLTGAGFGGCVIALVRDEAVDEVAAAVAEKYPALFPAQTEQPEIWPIRISDGARLTASPRAAKIAA